MQSRCGRLRGSLWRHGIFPVAMLALLLALPGCRGCRHTETPEEAEKREAEERAKKEREKEKPKEDFECKRLAAWPCGRIQPRRGGPALAGQPPEARPLDEHRAGRRQDEQLRFPGRLGNDVGGSPNERRQAGFLAGHALHVDDQPPGGAAQGPGQDAGIAAAGAARLPAGANELSASRAEDHRGQCRFAVDACPPVSFRGLVALADELHVFARAAFDPADEVDWPRGALGLLPGDAVAAEGPAAAALARPLMDEHRLRALGRRRSGACWTPTSSRRCSIGCTGAGN